MPAPLLPELRRRVLATPAGRRLRGLRRAFEPEHITRDRADMAHLRALLAHVLRPDHNCVDIGAHTGAVLTDLVRLAPQGHHAAFEPLPALAAALARDFPAVEVHALALSDRAGEREFVHVVDDPGWSGFVERPVPGAPPTQRLAVATATLDDVLPADRHVHLLKLDVEGAELEVLHGARATIARCSPVVVFEHGLGSADFYGTGPADISAFFAGVGLRLFTLAGDGPLDAAAFAAIHHARSAVNFVAHP